MFCLTLTLIVIGVAVSHRISADVIKIEEVQRGDDTSERTPRIFPLPLVTRSVSLQDIGIHLLPLC